MLFRSSLSSYLRFHTHRFLKLFASTYSTRRRFRALPTIATALTPLRLTGPNNYADWYARIENQAREADIWRYTDPDGIITLEEPSPPNPRKYYRLENHQPPQEEAVKAAKGAEARPSAAPTPAPTIRGGRRDGPATRSSGSVAAKSAVIPRIIHLHDLATIELSIYRIASDEYQGNKADYKEKKKLLTALREKVVESVATQYQIHIQTAISLRAMLKAIRTHVKPSVT